MCYNFRVKSKVIFTISLCTAIAAAGIATYGGSGSVYAATSPATHYPEIFTEYVNDKLDGFVDFATNGKKSYAFADRNGIIVVENEERTKYDIRGVSALDYVNGSYYYKLGSNSYSLSTSEPVNYEFTNPPALLDDGSQYEIIEEKCCYHAKGTYDFKPIDDTNECYKLKVYNNVAYAILKTEANEYGNTKIVKKLNGTSSEEVNPSYIDFTGVEDVGLGTIKSSLSSYNLEKPRFATLDYGSYYTEINMDNLSGDSFDADKDKTYKCGDIGAIAADEVMLVLGETGNAKVFTRGGECYIALSKNLQTATQVEDESVDSPEFTDAYINAPDFIYSAPYLLNATKAAKLAAGDAVKVVGKISSEIVGLQFYKIEFGDDDNKTTGYVLSDFLRPYTAGETEHPDDKNFGIIKDPGYTEDDYVKIVVLLLIVVVLVLIGFAYISYILTNKRRKSVKPIETDKPDEESKKE